MVDATSGEIIHEFRGGGHDITFSPKIKWSFYKKLESYDEIFQISITSSHLAGVKILTGDTVLVKEYELGVTYVSPYHIIYDFRGYTFLNEDTNEMFFMKFNNSFLFQSPVIKDDILYFQDTRFPTGIYAFDLKGRKILWCFQGASADFFLEGDIIYTNKLKAIDRKTGKLLWKNELEGVNVSGIVGDYFIGSYDPGHEANREMILINKYNGKPTHLFLIHDEICYECFDNSLCYEDFTFAKYGEGTKTAAIVPCKDGKYLYIFDLAGKVDR